jgi:hypothetical protein
MKLPTEQLEIATDLKVNLFPRRSNAWGLEVRERRGFSLMLGPLTVHGFLRVRRAKKYPNARAS